MEREKGGVKSLHECFDTFRKECYSDVGPTAVLAMRRAFFAGYSAHAEHTVDLIRTDDKKEMTAKTIALMMSLDSFTMECDLNE